MLTFIRCPFHPRVTAVAGKRPQSFRQKCRWQVTPKHAYTLDSFLSLMTICSCYRLVCVAFFQTPILQPSRSPVSSTCAGAHWDLYAAWPRMVCCAERSARANGLRCSCMFWRRTKVPSTSRTSTDRWGLLSTSVAVWCQLIGSAYFDHGVVFLELLVETQAGDWEGRIAGKGEEACF